MVSLSSESVQKLALLRFRATGTGVKIITFFQNYQYDLSDPLEPCRFEALCRLKSIAEFSSCIPEYVLPSPDGQELVTTMDLLNDWISVSSEILQEFHGIDPQDLSPVGLRMVDFFSQVMQPHASIEKIRPSQLSRHYLSESEDKVQTVLDWFEDCHAWVLDIKYDLEQSWLQEDAYNNIPLHEIYTPLNAFLLGPGVHFMTWLLYYWRRNATTVMALPFEQTATAPYMPSGLIPYQQGYQYIDQYPDPNATRFWQASRYPVRGSWGSSEVHDTICNLLDENIQVAHQRLFNTTFIASTHLSHQHLAFTYESDASPYSSPEPQGLLLPETPYLSSSSSSSSSSPSLSDPETFTCTSCHPPIDFTLAKDLKRHVESIHSKQRFYCDEEKCSRARGKGRPFNRIDNLVRHVRSRHGKVVDRFTFRAGREA